ncbi:Copia protein [Pseudolycoriella hygida]|uniref:Copia protein n=1 Tax=Pseudolycoriella hygida TaxID=35572 RepID=A0A9Q0NG13_9DIPT|nr:Copia protein [Pseudolycoriella hygida]
MNARGANFKFRCYRCQKTGHKWSQCKAKIDNGTSKQNESKIGNKANIAKKQQNDEDNDSDTGTAVAFPAFTECFDIQDESDHDRNHQALVVPTVTSRRIITMFLDSGATSHMINDRTVLESLQKSNKEDIRSAKQGAILSSNETGDINGFLVNENQEQKCILKNVLYVKDLSCNLMSIAKMEKAGMEIIFKNGAAHILWKGKLLYVAKRFGNTYRVDIVLEDNRLAAVCAEDNKEIWHNSNCLEEIKWIKLMLSEEFEMTDLNEMETFLGIHMKRSVEKMEFSQKQYQINILKKFEMTDCKSSTIPMENGLKFSQKQYQINILEKFEMTDCKSSTIPMENGLKLERSGSNPENVPYRELIGCLMYISLTTRPDLAAATNFFSRYQSGYDHEHFTYAKHILRYIKGTLDLKLIYKRNDNVETLTGYADADWANDPNDRKSISDMKKSEGHDAMAHRPRYDNFLKSGTAHSRSSKFSGATKINRSVTSATITKEEYLKKHGDRGNHLLNVYNISQNIAKVPHMENGFSCANGVDVICNNDDNEKIEATSQRKGHVLQETMIQPPTNFSSQAGTFEKTVLKHLSALTSAQQLAEERQLATTVIQQLPQLLFNSCHNCSSTVATSVLQQLPQLFFNSCHNCSSTVATTVLQQLPQLFFNSCHNCSSTVATTVLQQLPQLFFNSCHNRSSTVATTVLQQLPQLFFNSCHNCSLTVVIFFVQQLTQLFFYSYQKCYLTVAVFVVQQLQQKLPQLLP